jgi:DNA invertase Pin-like site-specific DNA recombinase
MQHAYVRCSTADQNPQLQLDAMRRAGVTRIWQEQRSAVQHRPELVRMLYNLRRGDEVVVWKLDRLARSLSDLLQLLQRIEKAGASIRSLTEPLDTGSAIGRMFVHMLGSFAEFERSMIKERCAAGIVAAKARGVQFGRVPYLDRDRITALLAQGMSHSAVARELGCHQATVSRLVAQGEVHQPPAMRRRRGSHT